MLFNVDDCIGTHHIEHFANQRGGGVSRRGSGSQGQLVFVAYGPGAGGECFLHHVHGAPQSGSQARRRYSAFHQPKGVVYQGLGEHGNHGPAVSQVFLHLPDQIAEQHRGDVQPRIPQADDAPHRCGSVVQGVQSVAGVA